MKKISVILLIIIIFFLLTSCRDSYPYLEADESNFQTESDVLSNVNEEDFVNKITKINQLRPNFNKGTCNRLKGDISVFLFFIDDYESEWTYEKVWNFTENDVEPALEFLEKQAEQYGVKLNLIIRETFSYLYYSEEVEISPNDSGYVSTNVLNSFAKAFEYESDYDMANKMKAKYNNEVLFLTFFNKDGNSYSLREKYDVVEHGIVFAYDLGADTAADGAQASIVARRILYLYGGEFLSIPESRKKLANKYYSSDVMLTPKYDILQNNIGYATAFYVGWVNNPPNIFSDKNWVKSE